MITNADGWGIANRGVADSTGVDVAGAGSASAAAHGIGDGRRSRVRRIHDSGSYAAGCRGAAAVSFNVATSPGGARASCRIDLDEAVDAILHEDAVTISVIIESRRPVPPINISNPHDPWVGTVRNDDRHDRRHIAPRCISDNWAWHPRVVVVRWAPAPSVIIYVDPRTIAIRRPAPGIVRDPDVANARIKDPRAVRVRIPAEADMEGTPETSIADDVKISAVIAEVRDVHRTTRGNGSTQIAIFIALAIPIIVRLLD